MTEAFTADSSALLLIDHRVGTMQPIKNLPLDQVKRFTLALAKAAKALGMPVILTSSQEKRVQGPLLPELQAQLPEAFKVRIKRAGTVNAWAHDGVRAPSRRSGAGTYHGGRHHRRLSRLPVDLQELVSDRASHGRYRTDRYGEGSWRKLSLALLVALIGPAVFVRVSGRSRSNMQVIGGAIVA